MPYGGLTDGKDVDDIIAYLKGPQIGLPAMTRAACCLRFMRGPCRGRAGGGAAAGARLSEPRQSRSWCRLPSGSGIDPTARIIGDELEQGAQAAGRRSTTNPEPTARLRRARSRVPAPDGYTTLYDHGEHAFGQSQSAEKHSIRPGAGFRRAVAGRNSPFMLVIDPKIRATSVPEFIAYVKANPGKLSYASTNAIGLVAGATLKRMADLDLVHVPYRSFSASHQRCDDRPSGDDVRRLRARLAAGEGGQCPRPRGHDQGAQRAPARHSIHDGGRLPSFDLIPWNAIFAPANTPKPIVLRLNARAKTGLLRIRRSRNGWRASALMPLQARPRNWRRSCARILANWTKVGQGGGHRAGIGRRVRWKCRGDHVDTPATLLYDAGSERRPDGSRSAAFKRDGPMQHCHYRDSSDAGYRHDRRRVLLQKSEGGGLGIGSTGGFHVEPGHAKCAHPRHRDPGGRLFRHQPGAVDPGRLWTASRDPSSTAARRPSRRRARRSGRAAAASSIRCASRSSRRRAVGPQVPRSQ